MHPRCYLAAAGRGAAQCVRACGTGSQCRGALSRIRERARRDVVRAVEPLEAVIDVQWKVRQRDGERGVHRDGPPSATSTTTAYLVRIPAVRIDDVAHEVRLYRERLDAILERR